MMTSLFSGDGDVMEMCWRCVGYGDEMEMCWRCVWLREANGGHTRHWLVFGSV